MAAYRLGPYRFDVEAPADVDADLAPLLARYERSDVADHRFRVRSVRRPFRYEVRLDGQTVHRANTTRAVADFILWRVSADSIERIHDHLALHAGAVSRARRAILLPAPPDSGKSTLTAALVARGYRYLSDEAALVDPKTAKVVPFPRAMWLEPGGRRALARLTDQRGAAAEDAHPAHALPSRPARAPSTVALIVFPRFDPSVETAALPVPRPEALLDLARESFNFHDLAPRGLFALRDLVSGASAFSLPMSDLGRAVEIVDELFHRVTRT